MADRKTFSRYNMRCGLVLRAKEAGVRITGFTIPDYDQRFLVLTGKDIHENSISFFGETMPLLALDTIDYAGQPILALFGPDYEAVELLLEKIVVNTAPLEDKSKKEGDESKENAKPDKSTVPSLEFSWGQDDLPEDDVLSKLKKVDSTFRIKHTKFTSPLRYRIKVWQDGNNIHVMAPMQWPELVKTTISTSIDRERKNIVLHPQPYHDKHDEYLMFPALYATLASIAALLTGLPIEIRMVGQSASAGIKIQRTTYLNDDSHPLAENVKMIIDQGAYCFASAEFQRQAMAGLIPFYNLKSFKAEIIIDRSDKFPALFCESLGYSEALAGTQFHTSMIANSLGTSPAQARSALRRDKTRFTDYAPAYDLDSMSSQLEKISEQATFDRKWASNSFFSGKFGLLGILKGIGISSGIGIAGLSATLSRDEKFSSLLCYTPKRNITLNTSALLKPEETKYFKSLVSARFNGIVEDDNVLFLEHNPETLDSGPNVLSRFQSNFPEQLELAAKKLCTLIAKAKPPISLKFDTENIYSACEFEYLGYGALVIEIEISKNDFIPMIKEAWGVFLISKLIDGSRAKDNAKDTILSTLEEAGGVLSSNFKLHLDMVEDRTKSGETLTPVKAIARALALSSFSSALYQVAGAKATVLPISATKLESILNGGKSNEN